MGKQSNTGVLVSVSSTLPAQNDKDGFEAINDFTLVGEVLMFLSL